jgi:hypothetical protein
MLDDRAELATDLLREFEQLRSIRSNWESYWGDIAKRVHPNANVFGRALQGVSQAERRTEWIYDSTPVLGLESFAAVAEMLLAPRNNTWHNLVPEDSALKDDREVRAALEDVTRIMFKERYSPKANFAGQFQECLKDLGAFGTTSLFIDERADPEGPGLQYRSVPLQDLYFAQNNHGMIDRVFRKFLWSAQNAYDEWGDKCPPPVINALQNEKHREFEFLHAVRPRKNPEHGRSDFRGMAFESYYVMISPKGIIDEGGYRTIPYATSRYTLSPREVYGRSPAMLALADTKMLMEMSRTDINASQLIAQPAILLGEEGNAFNLRPGALNYGMVSNEGRPLALPFNGGSQPDITEEKMQKRRDSINQAFLSGPYSIMKLVMDNPNMQPTTLAQLAQERGMLLTPVMGRQHSEFLGVAIRREFNILYQAGLLPDLPDKLLHPRSGRAMISIEYSSPLNRDQRAGEAVAIMDTLRELSPLVAAGHPEVFRPIDFSSLTRELWEIKGAPAKLLLSPEAEKAIADNQAQEAKIQGLVAAAPQLASAAKDAAQAHSTAMDVPMPGPGAAQ